MKTVSDTLGPSSVEKAQHTPGPWHRNIKPASKYTVIFAGRNTHVARLVPDGLTDDEVEANCNLIAAAPDLLAALEAMLTIKGIPTDATHDGLTNCDLIARARSAIAKAKGVQS